MNYTAALLKALYLHLLRITLNKNILEQFLNSFLENKEIERIVHHAKNANEYHLVVQYAPQAAKAAACPGRPYRSLEIVFVCHRILSGNR